jgi:multisubunit Na+/H+ antiporter MnhC subunit
MIAALILTAAVVGLALLVVCAARGPREVSAATRPASSNRKAGRTRVES